MPSIDRLVLGSHNQKKCEELRLLLVPLGIQLLSLEEFDNPLDVAETGDTFLQNASLKACQQAKHLGMWTIGEDSGLCVPHLDGAPGVYSARYSDPGATDERNNQKLLKVMAGADGEQRRAFYDCTIVLSNPDGEVIIQQVGRCWGRLTREPRGSSGFGYDPLFEIPEYHRTFGELGMTVKSVLSHRARALEKFVRELKMMH